MRYRTEQKLWQDDIELFPDALQSLLELILEVDGIEVTLFKGIFPKFLFSIESILMKISISIIYHYLFSILQKNDPLDPLYCFQNINGFF